MNYYPTLNPDEILTDIERQGYSKQEIFILFVGEASAVGVPALLERLITADIPFVGAIFPGVIYNTAHYVKGAVMTKMRMLYEGACFQYDLANSKMQLEKNKELIHHLYQLASSPTALVLVDGLSSFVESFLDALFNYFGNSVSYIGGGAGRITLEHTPCIFCHEGLMQDKALVVLLDSTISLGVQHGWEDLMGPVMATRTEGNVIHELNWQNAFEVYQAAVNRISMHKITNDNFFDIAKRFPFGIFKEGVEKIVRDPITVNEAGALTCVGQVPQNTVLYILQGKADRLIYHAGIATERAQSTILDKAISDCLIMDCISRVLFLEDYFDEELISVQQRLNNEKVVPFGALTLGEISSYETGLLEFFNKTIVVGLFYE